MQGRLQYTHGDERYLRPATGISLAVFIWFLAVPSSAAQGDPAKAPNWQSPARLRHGLKAATGNLIFSGDGIEFRSGEERFSHRWLYSDVKTFDLTLRRLVIVDYENRHHRMPGERRFRFDLGQPVKPSMAAELAQRVGKPVRNGVPDPKAASFFTIPAHLGARFRSSNGILRFRDGGIDYVTETRRDARSWRWADIRTLANPDRYHFRVGGYQEAFDFELKQPMPPELFDRLWDRLYAHDLNVSSKTGGMQ